MRYSYPAPAVAAFVLRGKHILLVKRNIEPAKGKWTLPSGFIEYGEEPYEAFKRELREELGIEIRMAKLFTSKIGRAHKKKLVLGLFYIVSSYTGKIKLSEENLQAKWFDLKNLPQIGFKDNKEAIEEYMLEVAP